MPKGIPKNGINRGWFSNKLRPEKKTGVYKTCVCGTIIYCEKSKINRKKYCSLICKNKFSTRNYKHSEETKIKMQMSKKGKLFTNEHKQNISKALSGNKHTKEHIEKNRIALMKHYDKIGRKDYKRYYHFSSTTRYKQWRTSVFERDKFTCQLCGLVGVKLQAHHIYRWAEHSDKRYDLNNGITVCVQCHPRKKQQEKEMIPLFLSKLTQTQ